MSLPSFVISASFCAYLSLIPCLPFSSHIPSLKQTGISLDYIFSAFPFAFGALPLKHLLLFFFLISFHWHYPLVLSLYPCILLSTYPILIYYDKSVRFTKSSALDSHIQQKHNIIFSMENFTLDVQSILLKDIFKVLLN